MARPYRVLLVALARAFGGAEVRVLTQARALQGAVDTCGVAVLAGSPLHARLQAEGLPHHALSQGRGSLAMLLALRRLIRQEEYQIVDAHNVQSIFWGHLAAALAGAPGRVATIHSDYGREYPGLKGRLYETVLRLDRPLVKETINVTEVLQAKSERQGNAAHATLIYNAVPVPDQPWSGSEPARRAEWGFAPDDFIAASVARLKPVKGHTYLLDALAQVADRPHIKLLLVGDGPLREPLEQQVAALGLADRVHFTGLRDDVLDILRACDCLCMASLSEALPYAVLEAGSLARPLLVTAVGGLATLLEDGKTALLVPPRDARALADGLRRLDDDRDAARRMGTAFYEVVRDSFSVDVMIDTILQVYDRAIR